MKRLYRKTKRLVVRPLRLEDFEAWREAHASMRGAQNSWDLGAKPAKFLTMTEFKKMLATQRKQRESDTFYSMAVFDAAGRLVGGVSIMEVSRGISQTAYLGYRIFNDYWGQGFGKEAVKAVLDIGFRDVKLHRIEAGIEPRNRRSHALAKSLGLRREGLKKRALYLRGDWIDITMYTATCEEFGIKWKGIPKVHVR
ncbi:MAG: GNAT family protein [Bdellovibrionota bacterium]